LYGKLSVDLLGVLLILLALNLKSRATTKLALIIQALHVLWMFSLLIAGVLSAAGLPSFLSVQEGHHAWRMVLPILGWGIVNEIGLIDTLKQKPPATPPT